MIKTKDDLKRFLSIEKQKNNKRCFSYIRLLRICEYLKNSGGGLKKFLFLVFNRKRNALGQKLGYEIGLNVFGEGLKIIHTGTLVINGSAKVGKNCTIIGSACIGGKGGSTAAHIGDNCEPGMFSVVLGDIVIGNNCFIGAGAVVTKSFEEDNISLAGVPAKIVRRF